MSEGLNFFTPSAEQMRKLLQDKYQVAEMLADLQAMTDEELEQRMAKADRELERTIQVWKEILRRPTISDADKAEARDFLEVIAAQDGMTLDELLQS
jgi:hypothetical protein